MIPVTNYPQIQQEAHIAHAIEILQNFFHKKDGTWYGFQSLLVLGKKNVPTGILTLRGLLNAFKLQGRMEHLLKTDPTGLFFLPSISDPYRIRVKDLMRPFGYVSVQEDEYIFKAVKLMVTHKVNSIPVMSGKSPVGMVRTIDTFWIIGELLD
jgi:hypothetical protein